jgi:hypothetical protein
MGIRLGIIKESCALMKSWIGLAMSLNDDDNASNTQSHDSVSFLVRTLLVLVPSSFW